MSAYTLQALRADVRKALDENVSEELSLNANTDTLSVDELIDCKIPIAVRIVITLAPASMLDGVDVLLREPPQNAITWIGTTDSMGNRPGEIPVGDMLRLISFRMSDWQRSVREFISDTDPRYDMQWSKFGGVRGNPEKPVVAYINRGSDHWLQFFSSHYSETYSERATIAEARAVYVPRVYSATPTIDIPDMVKDAAVQYTAYLVALTLNQQDAATRLMGTAKQLLTI